MPLQGQPPFGDSPYVRIIAGSNKGARIFAPKGQDTRPTGDRAREAAFNLIGPVEGAAVLAEDGLVVVETGARDDPELPPLSKRTSRRYGSARISLFEHP